MLLRNFVYYSPILTSFFSILSIILASKNKDKRCNKYISIFCIINILYLIITSMLLHNLLSIIVNLNFLIIWFISIIGTIFYVISIIICLMKRKKLNSDNNCKKIYTIFLIELLTPIILFLISLCYEIYLVNNSFILLKYNSNGNGGFGDSEDFIYAISDKYCSEVSIDIGLFNDYYKQSFLFKNIKEINENDLKELGVKTTIDNDSYILVYKYNKLVCKEKVKEKYFNIDLNEIYYNKKN